jgi:EpsI family protein
MFAVVGILAMSALALVFVDRAESIEAEVTAGLQAPETIDGWQRVVEGPLWAAAHQETPHAVQARYRQGEKEVQLFAVLFPRQRQGAEAISGENRVAEELDRSVDLGRQEVSLGSAGAVATNRSKAVIDIGGQRQEHLVWQWYRVAGRSLTNRYEGKAWEALARLYPGRADGLWLAVSTPLDSSDPEMAEQRLAAFVQAAIPELYRQVDAALGVAD